MVATPDAALTTGDDSVFADADNKFVEPQGRNKFIGKPKTSSSSFLLKHDSQSLLPPSLIKSKSKNAAQALPQIDHQAQREKLRSIIDKCDDVYQSLPNMSAPKPPTSRTQKASFSIPVPK